MMCIPCLLLLHNHIPTGTSPHRQSTVLLLTVFPNFQVIPLEGPLFCLGWCKRKRWVLVGGNARLHVFSVRINPKPVVQTWHV